VKEAMMQATITKFTEGMTADDWLLDEGVSREDWQNVWRPVEYEAFVRLIGLLRGIGWDMTHIERRRLLREYLEFVGVVEDVYAYYIKHEPKASPREHVLATAHKLKVMDTDVDWALIFGDARRGYRAA
jgi:hypothetical protein